MADPTAPAATAATPSAMDQILPWIQFALQYQQANKSGTFVQPPMSAQQSQMFDFAMHYLQTTPDNRQTINAALGFDLAHPATLDMAALKAGQVGYTPAQHMPGADLANLLRNQGTTATPAATTTPTSTDPGATIGAPAGGQGTGVFAPAGSAGDPLNNVPTTGDSAPPTDLAGVKQLATQYGPAAAQFVLGLITSNPYVTAAAAYKALQAYWTGQKQDQQPKDPTLPVKNPNYPIDELKPGGPPAPAPRTNTNPPGLTDPWSAPFMQNGNEGGSGLRPPMYFDPYAPGKPLP